MSEPIRNLKWRWQMYGGRWMLVTDSDGAKIVLQARDGHLNVRDERGTLQPIEPSDDIAKLLVSSPDVRRHAQSLVNGIDIGLVRFDTDADETFDNTMNGLRAALKAGAQ